MPNPRLRQAVQLLAQEAECGGKDHLIRGCVNEIEGRYRLGKVDAQERDLLLGILFHKDGDSSAQSR